MDAETRLWELVSDKAVAHKADLALVKALLDIVRQDAPDVEDQVLKLLG